MRPRNREINIFNMSLLDILCGALGAFCFMMLTLFPYYTKAKAASAGGSGDLSNQLQQAQQQVRSLQTQLAKAQYFQNQIMVVADWDTGDDVDQWVVDGDKWDGPKPTTPQGHKRDFATRDDQGEPGHETWARSGFDQGEVYKLFYRLSKKKTPSSPMPAVVRGYAAAFWIDPKDASESYYSFISFTPVMVAQEGQLVPVGELHIGANGPEFVPQKPAGQEPPGRGANQGRDSLGPGGGDNPAGAFPFHPPGKEPIR